jgi:geranylgeranyl diphosphate synthase type II
MMTLDDAQDIVSSEFEKLKFEVEPVELYEPIRYVLSQGGKRIRPALVLLAANVFTDDISKAIKPALGLEIFHNFTLLHDDIMDNALVRRGYPAVHVKWNNNVGILSGDAMSIKAYQYICSCDVDLLPSVLELFNQTALEVCEGQQYDMNYETLHDVSEEQYLMMIKLKTSVLLACSLKMGALLGRASVQQADALYQIGLNLGLAFQLQDDLLDTFGEEATFGKEIGKDIISNKKTYLLIKALDRAKGEVLQQLRYWITTDNFNATEKIKSVKEIFNLLGIKELVNAKIDSYFDKAAQYLHQLDVDDAKKQALREFAESLHHRNK